MDEYVFSKDNNHNYKFLDTSDYINLLHDKNKENEKLDTNNKRIGRDVYRTFHSIKSFDEKKYNALHRIVYKFLLSFFKKYIFLK